jgi:hypothetical protein
VDESLKKHIEKEIAVTPGVKTVIVIDDRPCSLEVNKTAKGDFTFSMKVYVKDANDMLATIPSLRKIRAKLEKDFKPE